MRSKVASLSLVLVLMSAIFLTVVPVRLSPEVYGPRADYLKIRNYGDPFKECAALETGEIDITDWPMTKTWIDKFARMPEKVTLLDYSEIGEFGYAINNQRWPTGVGDRPGDTLTYDPETGTKKHWFNPTNEWDLRAWMFRLAIAYLTDRAYISTEILKGYGYMMDTYLPVPALAGYLDYKNLTESSFVTPYGAITIPSLIFSYNPTMAAQILDAAGFADTDGNGVRNDPRKAGYPGAGSDLDPLIFYIRLDDPNRKAAGEKLAKDMTAIGIPVDARVVEKTVCFKSVMVEYNYHLYTEGYSLGADTDFLYGILHSSQYWAPIGWSGGYQGFCHGEHDKWALAVKNPPTYGDMITAVRKATFLESKYVASIPLWCSAGVQGYTTGWTGVVNHEGYGPSAPITGGGAIWSFLNMRHPTKDTITWGFKSNMEGPSVITAEWVWDWQLLDRIYCPLLVRNPYNLAEDFGTLALYTPGPDGKWKTADDVKGWLVGVWNFEGTEASYINFTLRPNAKWHDGSQVKPEDIKFSFEFTRDCGPGVAWNWASVKDLHHVDTWGTSPDNWGVTVYFKVKSYWALHWAGYLPMMKKAIWMAASQAIGFGYTPPTVPGEPGTFVNRMKVRDYHPWEHDVYNAATGGVGADDTVDLRQDGTGPWIFVDADLMLWADLEANRNWYLTQSEVESYLAAAFHDVGDVNKDRKVDISDLGLIARALGTTPASPPGTGWDQWNEAADLNKDGKVDIDDLVIAGRYYGKVAG